MKVAVYASVSTADQHCSNQLEELRRYVAARGWTVHQEYVDEGVSGAKESRPALDLMIKDARRRRFDVVCAWKLDRLGRNLRHLVTMFRNCRTWGSRLPVLARASTAPHLLASCSSPSSRRWRSSSGRGSGNGCS